MMRRCMRTVLCYGGLALGAACAHGVHYQVSEDAVAVCAAYHDAAPMAFCDVEVFAPGAPEASYQEGTTDPAGCFAFVPSTNGVWIVSVDDGMGHGVRAEVPVDRVGHPVDGGHDGVSRPVGLLIGLCLIIGLLGVYRLARQANGHSRGGPGCGSEECACTSPKE